MYQHVLIIHGSQSEEKRIALHKHCKSIEEVKEFIGLNSKLNEKFESLTFGFHHIQTSKESLNSVVEYDHFFERIDFYTDYDKFVGKIEEDITIKPIDIVRMILSKRKSSPLEIQKLMYLLYCEALDMYGEELFDDEFEAWRYGPVIPEVYHSIKHHGSNVIEKEDEFDPNLYSRMMKIPQYKIIDKLVDYTIEKYKGYTPSQLVRKTHIKDEPWDIIYRGGLGECDIIPKDLIRDYVIENKEPIIRN